MQEPANVIAPSEINVIAPTEIETSSPQDLRNKDDLCVDIFSSTGLSCRHLPLSPSFSPLTTVRALANLGLVGIWMTKKGERRLGIRGDPSIAPCSHSSCLRVQINANSPSGRERSRFFKMVFNETNRCIQVMVNAKILRNISSPHPHRLCEQHVVVIA